MKIKNLLITGILSLVLFASCDDDDTTATAQFTTVDATAYEWVYFSFDAGDTVSVSTPEDSEAWDIAFQRTDFKTNSGTSGTANGGVYKTSITALDGDLTIDDELIVADDSIQVFTYGMGGATLSMAAGSAILTGIKDESAYYTVDGAWSVEGENQYRTYIASPEVFVIKCADGDYAKIKFASYYSLEDGATSAHVSFDYIKE